MESAALKEALSSLGFRELRRIVVGWQSLAVYDARVDRQRVAVKVLDPKVVERSALGVRLDVQSKLATATDIVCGPVLVGDGLVNEIAVESAGTVYAVAHQFAEGDAPDINDQDDVAQMGRLMAELEEPTGPLVAGRSAG